MRRQCIPGSFFSAYAKEPGDEGRYLPEGVVKVVRCLEVQVSGSTGDRGTCQNPLFASSSEKYYAPLSLERISSTVVSGYVCFHTL